MFHRRVLLLGGLVSFLFVLLLVRLAWMTTGDQGVEAREKASKSLVRETWLPTVRGTIFDRKGRVLAGDRASYNIGVDYRVLAGQWVYIDGYGKRRGISISRYARRLAERYNKDVWDKLEDAQQNEIISKFESALEDRVESMFEYIAVETQTPLVELLARRDEIVQRVSKVKREYTERTRKNELKKYEERGDVPNETDLDRIERRAARNVAEEEQIHHLVADVTDEIGLTVIRQSSRRLPLIKLTNVDEKRIEGEAIFPGLMVVDATARIYPYKELEVLINRSAFPPPLRADQNELMKVTDLGTMILGSVQSGLQSGDDSRRASAIENDEILKVRATTDKGTDRGRYIHGDRVGRTGLESSYEDHLRGLRGVTVENLQTLELVETLPTPGLDIHLTLDILLQARIRALLDPKLGLARVQTWHGNLEPTTPIGSELDAGVIVLEVATGEILAMVSTPVPPSDGDWTKYGVRDDAQMRLYQKIHSPYINRAIAMPYPPGSVAKALILTGAAKYGKYEQGHRIEATGFLIEGQPNRFRSWYYKLSNGTLTHFDQLGRHPNDIDALMVSSNVFFFTLGRELEGKLVADVYKMYGVGTPYNLGVGTEWPGSIGAFNGPGDGSDLTLNEATLLGIGQGPVTWTPLHAADSYATIARQGYRIHPKLIQSGRAPVVEDLEIPSWSISDAMEGLHEVVTNQLNGSGYGIRYEEFEPRLPTFNVPGIRVWGKTGTATAPDIRFDPDEIGDMNGPMDPIVVRHGDHSWFVTLVGPEGGEPQYAIAVVLDYAGSGGKVSGPINNQIIYALIEEGYLPRVSTAEVSP